MLSYAIRVNFLLGELVNTIDNAGIRREASSIAPSWTICGAEGGGGGREGMSRENEKAYRQRTSLRFQLFETLKPVSQKTHEVLRHPPPSSRIVRFLVFLSFRILFRLFSSYSVIHYHFSASVDHHDHDNTILLPLFSVHMCTTIT